MKVDAKIYPGSMGAAKLAIDLFGIEHIDVGSWITPVYVKNVEKEDIEVSKSLLNEYNLTIEITKEYE